MAKSKNRRPRKPPKPKDATVKQIRELLTFSQVELARVLGVHPITVSKWERKVLRVRPWEQAIVNVLARGDSLDWSDRHEILFKGKKDPVKPLFLLLQRVYAKKAA